jgi:histone H2B
MTDASNSSSEQPTSNPAPKKKSVLPKKKSVLRKKKSAPSKATTKAGKSDEKKRRRKKNYKNFYSYIYKVLKQVHPDIGISRKAMGIMDAIVLDMLNRIASQASDLLKYSGKQTLSSRDMQSAVRLLFPADLAKHAIHEGAKAVTKYQSSTGA